MPKRNLLPAFDAASAVVHQDAVSDVLAVLDCMVEAVVEAAVEAVVDLNVPPANPGDTE